MRDMHQEIIESDQKPCPNGARRQIDVCRRALERISGVDRWLDLRLRIRRGHDAMNFRTQLGLALKRQRERRDLTQETLAEMANISVRHLAAMEAGTKNFTIEVLEQLATALDWDPLAELTREGPPLSEAQAREVAERLGELNAEWEATFERLKARHAQFVAASHPARSDLARPDPTQADPAQSGAA